MSSSAREPGREAHPSPFVEIVRSDWAELARSTELPLSETEVVQLRGLGDRLSLTEVAEVYLPLSRLLTLYAGGARQLHRATSTFLGERAQPTPFVIGVAGSVAVGKSTIARLLREQPNLKPEWPALFSKPARPSPSSPRRQQPARAPRRPCALAMPTARAKRSSRLRVTSSRPMAWAAASAP